MIFLVDFSVLDLRMCGPIETLNVCWQGIGIQTSSGWQTRWKRAAGLLWKLELQRYVRGGRVVTM